MNQLRLTKAAGLSEPALLCLNFVTDGTNDPSVYYGPIESVTRISDAGGEDLYRVRLLESAEFYEPVRAYAAHVAAGVDTQYDAYIRTDAEPTSDPRVASREIDVAVFDFGTSAFVNNIDGPIVSVWAMIENAANSISS